MAYDEDLAHRMRELLAGEGGVDEKKMFGGLAFLIGGNMAIAASGRGGVLVRVGPEQADALVGTHGAEVAVMGSRPMTGWLRVGAEDVATRRQLQRWVTASVTYTRTLPPKVASPTRRRGHR